MNRQIPGIHHITAIAGDPQRNLDFYTRTLGLRLVKLTVNFDDPSKYHLYFGDEHGSPGTLLTFFPWPGASRGQRGVGQVAGTAFTVPEGSLGFWEDHLRQHGATVFHRLRRFDEGALALLDPDWMQLELVARPGADLIAPWEGGGIPPEVAIRGFDGATIWLKDLAPSLELLSGTMGFRVVAEDGPRTRLQATSEGSGSVIDLLHLPDGERGWNGAGTVHHIAWRTANEAEQMDWHQDIAGQGLRVTPVVDRQYFRSIYFREPGGVLYEMATDPPGMDWDEPVEALGTRLRLPTWLEPERERVEAALPALRLPSHAPAN